MPVTTTSVPSPSVGRSSDGATDVTTGASYDVVASEMSDICPRTVTIHRSTRPVPGAVRHRIIVCGVTIVQLLARYSVPDTPYVTDSRKSWRSRRPR